MLSLNEVDFINCLFDVGAAFAMISNCYSMHRDKVLKGTSLYSNLFFCTWGWWNIYFFYRVDTKFSFYAAIFIALVNLVFISQLTYYKFFYRRTNERTDQEVGRSC
jgi:hypothetical protein